MILPSEIRFADKNIQEAFYKLQEGDSSEKELFKLINQAMDNIEKNVFCGVQIQKNLIPNDYIKKYGIKNLWKYDLPKGWRIIYSITGGEAQVISLILEWFDHKNYERRFNY